MKTFWRRTMEYMKVLFLSSILLIFNLHGASHGSNQNRQQKQLPPLTSLYIQDPAVSLSLVNNNEQDLIPAYTNSESMKNAKKYLALKKKIEEGHSTLTATSKEIRNIQEQTIYYTLKYYEEKCTYVATSPTRLSCADNEQCAGMEQLTQIKVEFSRIVHNTEIGNNVPRIGLDMYTLIDKCLKIVPTVKDLGQCIETLNKNIAQERKSKQPGSTIKKAK